MYDQYNRKINYMRISLTDRCNLHCKYCRPQVAQHLEHRDILRYEEILRIARCAVALGITRFKITGGEPLVRKGAVDFIAQLKALSGVEQVTLTTNGVLLEQSLPQLLEAGIDGINISLDTLNPEYYRELTGGGEVEAVVSALKAAVNAGVRCKLNCVPLKNKDTVNVASLSLNEQNKRNVASFSLDKQDKRNVASFSLNEQEKRNVASFSLNELNILQLVAFATELGIPLRFIELMPLACNGDLVSFTGSEIRAILQKAGYRLRPITSTLGNGPAEYYEFIIAKEEKLSHNDFEQKFTEECLTGTLGFIEPLHHRFCASCNRVRLTSTGMLKPCLYSPGTLDVRELVRKGASEAELTEALRKVIYAKPLGHHFEEQAAGFSMNEIGG